MNFKVASFEVQSQAARYRDSVQLGRPTVRRQVADAFQF